MVKRVLHEDESFAEVDRQFGVRAILCSVCSGPGGQEKGKAGQACPGTAAFSTVFCSKAAHSGAF